MRLSRAYPTLRQGPPSERSPFGERLKAGDTRRTEKKDNGRIVQRRDRRVALVQLYAPVSFPPSETPWRRKFARELKSAVGDIIDAPTENRAR